MENSRNEPLLTPLVRWFMFAMVLANIGGSMYQILLPIYLTQLGASISQVGFIFTAVSMVMLVLQIFGGWVSDSIGRLRAIALGSVAGVIGFIAMVLAPTWQWMLLAMCIERSSSALIRPSFGAFIAENSTEENRGRVYGITDTIFQITDVIGPPIGGYLAGAYGFKQMLIVTVILYTCAAGLRIWMAATMHSTGQASPEQLTIDSLRTNLKSLLGMLFGDGLITWIFATDGIRDIAFRLSGELEPLYLEKIAGISLEQIGILGSIFSIAMMVTPIASGRISDRYGERVSISLGFSLVSIG
jgi:MFS family permease